MGTAQRRTGDMPVRKRQRIERQKNKEKGVTREVHPKNYERRKAHTRDIRSFLRNEVIAKTLYLCKDVETFGSGIRKIYTLCHEAGVEISYINEEAAFSLEFSRDDRNISPKGGVINGGITEAELGLLSLLKQSPSMTNAELAVASGKSERTISRLLSALKNKKLIQRIGSNKTGYWNVL